MYDATRHDGLGSPPAGQWAHVHPRARHVFGAVMRCTNGHLITLRSHEIASDGAVTPSVVCPVDGCSFHEWVRLDGYAKPAPERPGMESETMETPDV